MTGKKLDFIKGKKLPLDILMNPIFFGGMRGAGKTHGAKKLYEAGHAAGAQCISIAPVGKWWSLRLGKDGKSPGLKDVFIFGGTHGDVPLTPESGAVVAKLLVEKRIHAVIDVSLMRKGERNRFLAAFLEEFWLLKKIEDASFPVVLFLEEAHAICPQKPQPEQARMLGAAEDLVREGRNHGVGVVLLDQRSAVVNKNVIALVEVIIAMRTIHHLDRDTYKKWIDEKGDNDEWVSELKRLHRGEAFLCAPELGIFEQVAILPIDTFDATATASIGEKMAKVGILTPVDVSALRESLGQVIEEAEKNNPAALKRRIAELEKQLAGRGAKVETKIETKEVPVVLKADLDRMEKVIRQGVEDFKATLTPIQKALAHTNARVQGAERSAWTAKVNGVQHTIKFEPRVMREPKEGEAKLGKGAREMLKALASRPSLTKTQIGALSGMSTNSGTFSTYLSMLRTSGYISQQGEDFFITEVGKTYLGADLPIAPTTTGDLIALWKSKFPGKVGEMLQRLVDRGPDHWTPKEELFGIVGLSGNSGTSSTYLSMLRSNKLVVSQNGALAVSPDLFL